MFQGELDWILWPQLTDNDVYILVHAVDNILPEFVHCLSEVIFKHCLGFFKEKGLSCEEVSVVPRKMRLTINVFLLLFLPLLLNVHVAWCREGTVSNAKQIVGRDFGLSGTSTWSWH